MAETYQQRRARRDAETTAAGGPRRLSQMLAQGGSAHAGGMYRRSSRRGSVLESETDADSIFSDTTSNASAFSNPSAFLHQPRPQRIHSFDLHQHHDLSGPSSSGSSLSPTSAVFQRSKSPLAEQRAPSFAVPISSRRASSTASTPSIPVTKSARRERKREERSTLQGERFDTPLRRYVRNMTRLSLGEHTLGVGVAAVLLIKWIVGMGGYSGKGLPPMFGDFEAQRHWMEITANVPIKQWYAYGPEWWQLDYPPLTAYHSWICGTIGSYFLPSSFALDTSRGASSPALELYMRLTVLATELVGWIPVVWWWCSSELKGRSKRSKVIAALTILGHPALILIDNGHFQYNSIMLALTLLSIILFKHDRDLLGCIAFSASLGFKQMALYYSPAVFGYLLGKCFWLGGRDGLIHFAKLGVVTAGTFGIMFAPFLTPIPDLPLLVIRRIFPLARGIFEDKVANFWCASNVVIKWKKLFEPAGMAKLATLVTLIAITPTIVLLIWSSMSIRVPIIKSTKTTTPTSAASTTTPSVPIIIAPTSTPTTTTTAPSHAPPTHHLLQLSLLTSSLSFFLFSFQVHEKSVLLPLLPLLMGMVYRGERSGVGGGRREEEWEMGVLVGNVATFSMFPLLQKDGQTIQYFTLVFFWNYMVGSRPWNGKNDMIRRCGYLIYTLIIVHHLANTLINAPSRYPDLFAVLNVLISAGVLGGCWLWAVKRLLEETMGLGLGFGAGGGGEKREKKKE